VSRAWGEEYYVKRLGPHRCEVAKFNMTVRPTALHTVTYESCTCWVGFDCKHVKLVKRWQELGEPIACFWPEKDGTWRHEDLKGFGGSNP